MDESCWWWAIFCRYRGSCGDALGGQRKARRLVCNRPDAARLKRPLATSAIVAHAESRVQDKSATIIVIFPLARANTEEAAPDTAVPTSAMPARGRPNAGRKGEGAGRRKSPLPPVAVNSGLGPNLPVFCGTALAAWSEHRYSTHAYSICRLRSAVGDRSGALSVHEFW